MLRNRWAILLVSFFCACPGDESDPEPEQGPPPNRVFIDEIGEYVEDPVSWVASGEPLFFPELGTNYEDKVTCWVPDADSADTVGPIAGECEADGIVTGPVAESGEILPSKYCPRPGCSDQVEVPSSEGVGSY